MAHRAPRRIIRNVEAGDLLERFLVAAIAALLLIRWYLLATGYPQVGRGELHIAHLLWGGLLMAVALGLALSFLGRRVRQVVAIVGGIGFGTFIDELGKFITRDNDYFFRPTIALIYTLFVLLFLVARAVAWRRVLSPLERLGNALDLLAEEIMWRDLDSLEEGRARALLRQVDPHDPLAAALLHALEQVALLPPAPPDRRARLAARGRRAYARLIQARWFAPGLVAVFVAHAAFNLRGLLVLTAGPTVPLRGLTAWGMLGAVGLSGALVVAGIAQLPRSRWSAYRWFRRSLLVSICFVEVGVFYVQELSAIGGLALDLALLALLNRMISQERRRDARARRGEPPPDTAPQD